MVIFIHSHNNTFPRIRRRSIFLRTCMKMNELFKNLGNEKISLSYMGLISDGITDKFTALTESYLKSSSQLGKISNRTCFLIAECFQNTIRHREKVPRAANHRDFFHLSLSDDGVMLCSSNLILKEHIDGLKDKINHINSLDPDGLKNLYHEILTGTEGLSSKGGAGLGLIEMARKSSMPLKYHFRDIDGAVAEFFLALELKKPGESISVPRLSENMHRELNFYQTLVENNILVLFKGEFTREIISPLLQMMDANILSGDSVAAKDKKGLITTIEVVQNILKHAKVTNGERAGIFSISSREGGLVIVGGNFIERQRAEELLKFLESLKKMKTDDVIQLYKQRLASAEITPEGNSGLGLLEIARNSAMQFTYSFDNSAGNDPFFSIQIYL